MLAPWPIGDKPTTETIYATRRYSAAIIRASAGRLPSCPLQDTMSPPDRFQPIASLAMSISDADAEVVGDLIKDTTRRRRFLGEGSF